MKCLKSCFYNTRSEKYCNILVYKNSNELLLKTRNIYKLANYIYQPNCTYILQDPNKDAFEGKIMQKTILVSNNLNNSFNSYEDYLRYKKSTNIIENNFTTLL